MSPSSPRSPAVAARAQVIQRLSTLLRGRNLHDLAREHSVTFEKNGHVNKGWVGQTIERVAGIGVSNLPYKDGPDFELKTTSVVLRNGQWFPKEAMRITQLSPRTIIEETFETSALWNKLERLILVGVSHESLDTCFATQLVPIDLTEPAIIEEIRVFWEDIQSLVLTGDIADFSNLGSTNGYLQLRPTGTGKQWSKLAIDDYFRSRAFYATKRLLRRMLISSAPNPTTENETARLLFQREDIIP